MNAARQTKLSVVVVVRNDPHRLQRCLDSIRHWNPEAEIVTVDNDSVDETPTVGRHLTNVWSRCGGSVSECRFHGAQLASGDIMAFVDADQVVAAGTLTAAAELLRRVDAVVIPERPLRCDGWFMGLVASERRVTEWAGLGVPRVVTRSVYFDRGGHVSDLAFGEDRHAFAGLQRVGISNVPILHDEVPSLRRLLGKYYRYGARGRSRFVGGPAVLLQTIRTRGGGTQLRRVDVALLPATIGLKACKVGALLAGKCSKLRENSR